MKNKMEHPGEIWQEYDFNGEKFGGIDPNNYNYDAVRLMGGAAVMLYRLYDGEVEFLFQHRSKFLKGNPDRWDVSAGGHINLDESTLDAIIRETREEIGVNIERKKLEFAETYIRLKDMINLYFYDWEDRADEFSFDDQEVEEVKWVKYSELGSFLPNIKQLLAEDKDVFSFYYIPAATSMHTGVGFEKVCDWAKLYK